MEFPKEQCAEDTQQTEIQLDYSKSENAPEFLENVYAKGLNSIGSVGEGNSSLITNQTSSEIKENLDESQSSSKSSKLNIRESDSGLGPSDPEGKEPESVENADGMEVEIQSSSTNNDQSSNHDEKMTECSETPSSSMEDTNACKEVITTNSALKVVGIGDGKGTVYNSAPEVAEAQEGDTGGNRSASGEATVLCNSNALSALWDYGILISSDESSDDDNDEPSTDAVMQDASTPRQSVVSLDSDTSSMSSSTSLFFTDDSESEDEQASGEKNRPNPRPKKPLMTDGELGLEDLPPIQDLHITVPEHDCTKIGEVLHIVDKLVIVQGIKNMPPLDLESVLFLAWDRPLGLVFDVFGPVVEPSYCVRFNSNDEIISKNITPGMPVYFGQKSQYTNYVFMKHLLNAKGSDASWTDNNEPPLEQLEFSDDEAERAAKKAIKAINKEIKVDPDEPQRKKHMAYEQRMNAMNLYMTRVSEMKQQRKRRPPPRKEVGCGRLIHAPVLTTLPPTVFQQPPPTPFHGGVPPPSFAAPPLAFNRFVPPPPPTALPKPPSMFVDTSRPPPHSPQPMLAFPPPNMAVPPPTTPPLFCNVNVPPPPNQIFRANNSVNLNSLFPDLFRTAPPIPSPAFSFPPPPMALTTPPPPPVAIVKAAADSSAPNTNRLPLPVFNHNPLHRPPATPTPPPYSLYINKA